MPLEPLFNLPVDTEQLAFHDFPDFRPFLTPRQILELGVYGGGYFNRYSSRRGLPDSLFLGLPFEFYRMMFPTYGQNYFGVPAMERHSMNIPSQYKIHSSWLEWYAKFFYGQRFAGDKYRVEEWKTEIKVFSFYIRNNAAEDKWTNNAILPLWKQHLIQYAFDATKDPIDYL